MGCPLVVAFLSPSPQQEVRGVLTLALPGNNVHHPKCLEVKTTALSAKACHVTMLLQLQPGSLYRDKFAFNFLKALFKLLLIHHQLVSYVQQWSWEG